MNFDVAAEMARAEGIEVQTVVGAEDVASAPKGQEGRRRGVDGTFLMFKAAGAKANEMEPLSEVKRVAPKAGQNVRTLGVALTPCIIPEVGKPTFTLGDDEMEIGMGSHGEAGMRGGKFKGADEIVDEMIGPLLEDLPYEKGDEIAVLVNGSGCTPKEELCIIFRRISHLLAGKRIDIKKAYVGEFAASMEMAGFSTSLLRLDEELKDLPSRSARTPLFEQGAISL